MTETQPITDDMVRREAIARAKDEYLRTTGTGTFADLVAWYEVKVRAELMAAEHGSIA